MMTLKEDLPLTQLIRYRGHHLSFVLLSVFALGSIYMSFVSLPPVKNLVAPSFFTMSHDSIRKQHSSSEKEQERAVFYNIFIPSPSDTTGMQAGRLGSALEIVWEQLEQLSLSKHAKNAPIHYTLIGHNSTDDIQNKCGPQCRLSQYAQEGDESLTLQSLWEYCQDHPSTLVTYIHNKGSFHPSEENTRLRTMLTKSVFSDQCQGISVGNEHGHPQCDACSARFSPFPQWRMSGNMWTAQCSYVQNLHAPRAFESKMKAVIDFARSDNKDEAAPRPSEYMIKKEWLVSSGRFALEHWIGSHPDIRPCDVYGGNYIYGYQDLPDEPSSWEPKLQEAPWMPLGTYFKTFASRNEDYKGRPSAYLKLVTSDLTRNWLCGQARLLEFTLLYNKIPSVHSFFWSYYTNVSPRYCPIPPDAQLYSNSKKQE
jgi:hypothetical protein